MRINRITIMLGLITAMLFSSCTIEKLIEPSENSEDEIKENITYKIVDTGQSKLFSDIGMLTSIEDGDPFYGQDGNYDGNQPDYTDNGDGTVTDNVTGLMWQQSMDVKMTYDEAIQYANSSNLGGYSDWRVPSIKELFSLIDYNGESGGEQASILFIDDEFFVQPIGDVSVGEREIDAQVLSSTIYAGQTMNNNDTVFGVNFVDGRIKGYPLSARGNDKEYYVRLVRANELYGINQFVDNGDGTITDLATGLMWQQSDDSITRDWEESLDYCETLELADYNDWHLPNAKELQSIVDYTKSVQSSNRPAINDMFTLTKLLDVNNNENYGFYWTSTTHMDRRNKNDSAAYIAFGEALGKMNEMVMDVHGAGAVRSDPKSGNSNDYPQYFGPQGDIRYVYNYVLAVRTVGDEAAYIAEEIAASTEDATSDHTVNWTENTHSNNVEPNYEIVFDQSEVLKFNIVIDSADWQAMQDDLQENLPTGNTGARGAGNNRQSTKDGQAGEVQNKISTSDFDPIWVTSTVTFDGISWEHVGIRFKGNSSLLSAAGSGNNKLSFKLDFDEFEDEYPEIDNQRFYGFKQLNLNNNFSDESLMHEKVAADLFREFGLASAQTAFCIVNVDYGEGSKFFGVYALVEEMDDTGIETHFGDDSGNLYKPEGSAASFAFGRYNDDEMEKKSNEDEEDYIDVMTLYEVINSEDRKIDVGSWKSDLEDIFNVDGFLKWLAANTVMQNWDTYGNTLHNYYLYNDPETNQLNWIPWDNNEAFISGKGDKSALSLELTEANEKWPLIRHLIDDSAYKSIYSDYVKQFVDEVFTEAKMIETYNDYYEMIKEYAYAERTGYTFIKSDKNFDSTVEALKSHVAQRNTAVQNYLSN